VEHRVRVCALQELSTADVAAWERLEERALEPNAYLSPSFVLPAMRHLDHGARVLAFLVERGRRPDVELVGLALLRPAWPVRRLPLPHLGAYASRHSFLGGLLLDRGCPAAALDALFGAVRRRCWRWHGLILGRTWGDGAQAQLLRDWGECTRSTVQPLDVRERAVLRLPVDAEAHLAALSGSLRSNIKRRMRRLREQGRVEWRVSPPGAVPESMIDAFLSLEHRGWKGSAGSSLRSDPAQEAFFREVVHRFSARGRAMFTQIELDGRVIASTSNFLSGNAGFAFKVGWDPEYAKLSPGVLCEAEFLRAARTACPGLTFMDSGAEPGSYMDEIWTERRRMQTTTIALSPLARLAVAAIGELRQRRTAARARQPAPPSDAPPSVGGNASPERGGEPEGDEVAPMGMAAGPKRAVQTA
jgi:CelD/BcsL family acetyltransferase involved in cellulose biosynthesis